MVKREPEEWREPLYTPVSPSTPAYRNLAAPAPFAPSAYNIRCAKIGKSGERKEDGEGEKLQEERRTNRILVDCRTEEGGEERGNIGVPSWADDLYCL